MEFYETVNRRRSIRQFEDKPSRSFGAHFGRGTESALFKSSEKMGACCAYGQKRHFGRGEARKALLLPHRRA